MTDKPNTKPPTNHTWKWFRSSDNTVHSDVVSGAGKWIAVRSEAALRWLI